MVVDLLQSGGIAEAQGVLDAAGCTCPTGEVWRGIFDERGAFYQVPEWVVVDPANLLDEDAVGREDNNSEKDEDVDEDEYEELDDEGKLKKRDEKGKGKAVEIVPGEILKIKCRLSDRGTDVIVKVGKNAKVSALVKKVKEKAQVGC
jgi:hypothetical protein